MIDANLVDISEVLSHSLPTSVDKLHVLSPVAKGSWQAMLGLSLEM